MTANLNISKLLDVFQQNMIVAPYWWVCLYEKTYLRKIGLDFEYFQTKDVSSKFFELTPFSTLADLEAILIFLDYLREKFVFSKEIPSLENIHETFELPSEEILHVLSFRKSDKSFDPQIFFRAISNLKLLIYTQNEIYPLKLFEDESWQYNSEKLTLKGRVNAMINGFVLGFINPSHHVFDRQKMIKCAHVFSAVEHPCLLLNKSAFLEFNSFERYLYLLFLKGSEWQKKLRGINRVFSIELSHILKIFNHIVPEHTAKGTSKEERFLKFLSRFSQKLFDHGIIKSFQGADYLAFLPEEKNTEIVWRGSMTHSVSDFAEGFTKLNSQAYLETLARAPEKNRAMISTVARDQIQNLVTTFNSLEFSQNAVFKLKNRVLLSPHLLLFEWIVRSFKEHKYPVSFSLLDDFLSSHIQTLIVKLAHEEQNMPLIEKIYSQIIEYMVAHSHELEDQLNKTIGLTVFSEITQDSSEFASYQNETRKQAIHVKPVNDALKPKENEAQDQTNIKQSPSLANSKELKSIAFDELRVMKNRDVRQYEKITRAYLESLDEDNRKLLLEVKRKLNPSIFEKYMDDRIVKFMMTKPALWRSSASHR